MATPPARRNDSHTAAPDTAPAAPSSAKIPAPTIDPTPMKAAWRTVRWLASAGADTPSAASGTVGLLCDHVRAGYPSHDRGDVIQRADGSPLAGLAGKTSGRLDLRPHGTGRELMTGQLAGADPIQPARLRGAPVDVDTVHIGGHQEQVRVHVPGEQFAGQVLVDDRLDAEDVGSAGRRVHRGDAPAAGADDQGVPVEQPLDGLDLQDGLRLGGGHHPPPLVPVLPE